eukprot:scaffold11241_cov67-Skeletonema_dohrnii-CCMP3373.AAC.2
MAVRSKSPAGFIQKGAGPGAGKHQARVAAINIGPTVVLEWCWRRPVQIGPHQVTYEAVAWLIQR